MHGLVGEELADARRLAQEARKLTGAGSAHLELFARELLLAVTLAELDLQVGDVGLLEAQLGVLLRAVGLAGSDWIEALLGEPLGLVRFARVPFEQLFRVERLERDAEARVDVVGDSLELALLRDVAALVRSLVDASEVGAGLDRARCAMD